MTTRLAEKICPLSKIQKHCDLLRRLGDRIVATSGCFDMLHPGHVLFLHRARELFGTHLIVCLNSDDSVRRLKGKDRPLFTVADRALMLAALESVATVVVFSDDTPEGVLEAVQPHNYVKGPDYRDEDLAEASVVLKYGGEVHTLPYLSEHRTTALLERCGSIAGVKRRKRR